MADINTVYDAAYKGDYDTVVKLLEVNPNLITLADSVSILIKKA